MLYPETYQKELRKTTNNYSQERLDPGTLKIEKWLTEGIHFVSSLPYKC
jgi:hypothetical protein